MVLFHFPSLIRYDQKNRQFIGHINGNGLTTREYVLGSSMHTASDLIAFGTSDGITSFYPERVRAKKMELGDVHLTNFIIDGKPINCLTDEFTIPYEENSFTLEFSLLNYRNTDNIRLVLFHFPSLMRYWKLMLSVFL